MVVGCASYKDTGFITKAKVPNGFEYVGDIIVNKEGMHFLWFIPFYSASEDTAKETMEQKVKEKYPNAAGIYDLKTIYQEGVGLFDWRPAITLIGKVAKSPAYAPTN